MAYDKDGLSIAAQVILKEAVPIAIHNASSGEKPGPVDMNEVRAIALDLASVFLTVRQRLKPNGQAKAN